MFRSQLTILTLFALAAFSHESYSGISSPLQNLPEKLFWGKVNGTSYLTVTKNLKNIEYCSGSWAFAATSVLSDRFKVLRNASWPDYNISPQVALSCIQSVQGCHEEGDPASVYDYILQNGITDETCAIYQGRDFSNGVPCDRYARCKTCYSNGNCDIPSKYYVYNITGYVVAKGETQMINALQSGPIVCRLNSTQQFVKYNTTHEDIIVPKASSANETVYVSIVGYGVNATGTNYWIGRNSWGIGWGDLGFFNLIRGTDALGIEEYCVYPTPNLTITAVTTNSQGQEEKSFISNFDLPKVEEEPISSFRIISDSEKSLKAVPKSWDWRNANGKNYLSWVRNQNIPNYCDASWIFSPMSAGTDRFNILFFNDTIPQIVISPQEILTDVGACFLPADISQLYTNFVIAGYQDDTCVQYVASNNKILFPCQTCMPPAPIDANGNSNCVDVKPPITFYANYTKSLAGVTKMQQEIYTNGPISCGIYGSKMFANYTGGIYSEATRTSKITQYVSVVGWGVDPPTKNSYWIGRNSLGTGWGEYGFFRMQMYRDNLGIETDCVAIYPTFTPPAPF